MVVDLARHRLGRVIGHAVFVREVVDDGFAESLELVIDTRARFEVDPRTFRVTSADVPTPDSAAFQSCVEERAMTWSFPPPPGRPHPPKDMPKDAKLMVAVHIHREPLRRDVPLADPD